MGAPKIFSTYRLLQPSNRALLSALFIIFVLMMIVFPVENQRTVDKCNDGYWLCSDHLGCIRNVYVCDGTNDCYDFSDEKNCKITSSATTTSSSTTTRARRITPPATTISTTRSYTPGRQSEEDTPILPVCWWNSAYVQCSNYNCISPQFLCDGFNDCGDNSDELVCFATKRTTGTTSSKKVTQITPVITVTSSAIRRGSTPVPTAKVTSSTASSTSSTTASTSSTTMSTSSTTASTSSTTASTSSTTASTSSTMASTSSTTVSTSSTKTSTSSTSSSTSTIRSTSGVSYTLPVCSSGSYGAVQCRNSICIPPSFICDGFDDCGDGSDEINCQACLETEYECSNGKCIPRTFVCDGENDCNDGSDERPCPSNPVTTTTKPTTTPTLKSCSNGQYQCPTGQCIPMGWKCDGVKDCRDGSDENSLSSCPSRGCPVGQWRCPSGQCIMPSMLCNKVNDCLDNSDESGCNFVWTPPQYWNWTIYSIPQKINCTRSSFRCRNQNCIPSRWVCDGNNDCGDASDESNCTGCSSIPPDKRFYCANRDCVSLGSLCNGIVDCSDSSDEIGCYCDALQSLVTCRDGSGCINIRRWCDNKPDCTDGSDEANCTTVSCPRGSRRCNSTGQCLPASYTCNQMPDCQDYSDEVNCSCPADFGFYCRRPEICVSTGSWCNGIPDCPDGSDEPLNCSGSCPPNQFVCGNSMCVDLGRLCDKVNDCGDWTDEINCPCKTTDFRCSMGICIERTNICDGELNCPDHTDEEPTNCIHALLAGKS